MDPTTILGWLIGLSAWLFLLTFTVALDLGSAWRSAVAARPGPSGPTRADALAVHAQRHGQPDGHVVQAAVRASSSDPSTDPGGTELRGSDLLAPPPMVGDDTLRDWLIHYRRSGDAWMDVTQEFYARAAQDPQVADYFVGVDWPRLKNHFMATLVLITHTGVTRAMPATMAMRHRDVRNSAGDPITPEIYDAVIGVLVSVLSDFDTPKDTLAQLGRTVAPFRAAIARVPVPPVQAESPTPEHGSAWPAWPSRRDAGQ